MPMPSIVLEYHDGSSWVDLSHYLLAGAGGQVRISRGRSNEADSAQPGTCSFSLDNNDGRFTEDNPGSPLAGWRKWAPVRVVVNGSPRFHGFLQSLRAVWPKVIDTQSRVDVQAVDRMSVLGAAPMHPWAQQMLALRCDLALWPLSDPLGSTEAKSMVSTVAPLELRGLDNMVDGRGSTPGDAPPEGLAVSSMWGLVGAAGEDHARLRGWLPVETPPVTILAIFVRTADFAPGVQYGLMLGLGGNSIRVWQRESGGIELSRVSGTPAFAVIADALPLGVPTLIAVSVTATEITLRTPAGAVSVPWVAGSLSAPPPHRTINVGSRGFDSYGGALSGSLGRWALVGQGSGAMGEAEFGRLAELIGAPQGRPVSTWLQAATGGPVVIEGFDRPMLPPDASDPASVGDALADNAGAVWVADRATGTPAWLDHRYVGPVSSVQVELDSGAAWGSDSSLYITGATVDQAVVADRGATPKVTREVEALLTGPERYARARWLANSGDLMSAARLSGIELDLLTMGEPRTNLCLNPRLVAGGGTDHFQTRHSWTNTFVSGISDHPLGITTARQSLVGPSGTNGAGRGFDRFGNMDIAGWWNYRVVTPGVLYSASQWMRWTKACTVALMVRFQDAVGNYTSPAGTVATLAVAAGEWRRAEFTVMPPAGSARICYSLRTTTDASWTSADGVQITGVLDGVTGEWFDGDSPGAAWAGAAGNSTSTHDPVGAALALDLRHRIRPVGLPGQIPSPLRTLTVEGYDEVVALDEWTIRLNTAPDPRFILGDPVQGVLGAVADNRLCF